MTNEETKNGQIRFAQVLRQKVPDFFTLPCYTLQKNLFNLAFFTMICETNMQHFLRAFDKINFEKKKIESIPPSS